MLGILIKRGNLHIESHTGEDDVRMATRKQKEEAWNGFFLCGPQKEPTLQKP